MRTYDEMGAGEVKPHAPHPAEHESSTDLPPVVASRAAQPDAMLHLQQTAGNAAVVQLLAEERRDDGRDDAGRSPVLDVVGRGGGQALDPATRTTMEAGLGADFGDVRVHTDGDAATSAKAVQANAYTVGNDVVFQSGLYQPDTASGQRMLAHELTHVVQQRSGPVDGSPTEGGIAVSHPSDRFEQAAEANAERFVSSGSAPTTAAPAAAPAAAVQRSAGEQDDTAVQGLFVQREAAEEEKDEEAPVQGAFVQREDEEGKEEEPVTG